MSPSYIDGASGTSAGSFAELLRQAGVGKHSLIQVTGPDGLPMLLWLCRHGYEHVAYVRCGAPSPTQAVDVLLIPSVSGGRELAGVLDRAPQLHPGGLLIARVAEAANDDLPPPVVLERFGYATLGRFASRGGALYVTRRGAGALAKAS